MPIYEYKCEHCGEQFEVLQKLSDEPLTECILCSEGPVKKLMSSSSFILKGAGFYVNDYSKKNTNAEKKSTNGSTSTSDASDKSSSESTKSTSDSTKSASTTDTAKSA